MNLDEFFEVGDYDKVKVIEDFNNKRKDCNSDLIRKGLIVIEDIINNSVNGEMFSMNYKERIDLEKGFNLLRSKYLN
jgi:hypoxanthine-guanine phosphoribosyltransferase